MSTHSNWLWEGSLETYELLDLGCEGKGWDPKMTSVISRLFPDEI